MRAGRWTRTEQRAALNYFRRHVFGPAFKDEDEDTAAYHQAFFSSHGQDLDWIHGGNPAGSICDGAHHSRQADAELVTLRERMLELRTAEQEATAECMRTYDVYHRLRPALPRELIWRLGDPAGYVIQYSHLFRPNKHKQRRADQPITAYRRWRAEETAAEQSGYLPAEEKSEAIGRSMHEVYERMFAIKPKSIEGYRALASAVLYPGEIGRYDDIETSALAALVSALTGVGITETEAA